MGERQWRGVSVVVVLTLTGSAVASAGDAGSHGTSGTQRNQRYCEIIPSVTSGGSTTTFVYNTQGLNDCPAAQWNVLTEDEVNQEYGSQSAKLNGPRYWMMDKTDAAGASTTGKIFTFGGIQASLRATIVTPAGAPTVGDQYWVPNQVQRQTVFTFDAKKPIYELSDPNGKVYVMQAYAQIVAKNLTIQKLPALGRVLKLPSGWHFKRKVMPYALQLTANGVAYVVNDNLVNSYQQMMKPGVQLGGIPQGCVKRAFKVTAQLTGDTAVTELRLGTKLLQRSTSKTFTATVPARAGRLSIVAINDAGTARANASVRVCS